MAIREEMPVLVRHEGDWKGNYIYVDAEGRIVDQHDSHLTCSFPTEGEHPYHQINRYTWADGRHEEHQFPGDYADGKLLFDTARIKGHAWEVDENNVVLTWYYKDDPANPLYELIYISPCGNHRARTWHWFKDGELYKRTLIKERRVL